LAIGGALGLATPQRPALLQGDELLETQLATLKTKRSMTDEPGKIALLDVEIERRALSVMAARREALYIELEAASIRVRNLQAAVHAHRICLREFAETCTRPDDAKVMLALCDRWGMSSLPPTTATPGDVQEGRRQWLAQLAELLH
jgi:hypothetical protein